MEQIDLVYHMWKSEHLATSVKDTVAFIEEYNAGANQSEHVPTFGTTTYCMTAIALSLLKPKTVHFIVVANGNMQKFVRNKLNDLLNEMEPIFGNITTVNNKDIIQFTAGSKIFIRVMSNAMYFRGHTANSVFIDNHPFTDRQIEELREQVLPYITRHGIVYDSANTRW